MKKIIGLLLISFYLVSVSPVLAQAPTFVPKQAQKAHPSSKLYSDRITIVEERFSKRIKMYSQFIKKVEEIRNTLNTQGKDVTELDRLIRLAKDAYTQTNADSNEAVTTIKAINYTQNKGVIQQEVNAQIREVRTSFRTLHQAVKDVVVEISVLRAN